MSDEDNNDHQRQPDQQDRHTEDDEGRTLPEWVSFGVALVLVLALVGVFVADLLGEERPADPLARVSGPVQANGSAYQVPVTVRNGGDLTAADVQVTAELSLGSTTLTAEQTIPFLAGGAEKRLVLVFDRDPAGGDLEVRVASYSKP